MAVDLDGIDPAVQEAFRTGRDRVRRAQMRTVADYWYVGTALSELREIVRGMPGVLWGDVYGKHGLGFSESTQHRYRRLAKAYDTADEAGAYTSVNKALRAKGTEGIDPTRCPGWRTDGERQQGCDGTKRPQFRYCIPCSAAWEKWEKAEAKTRRTKRRHAKRLLEAALEDDVNAALVRQLEEAYDVIRSKEETIALYQAELVDCHERLQMVDQRSIPVPAKTPTVGETVLSAESPTVGETEVSEVPPTVLLKSPTVGETDWPEVVP